MLVLIVLNNKYEVINALNLYRLDQYLLESCDTIAGSIKSILMSRSDIPTIAGVLERLTSLFKLFSSFNLSITQRFIEHLATDYIIKACEKLATASQRNLPTGK